MWIARDKTDYLYLYNIKPEKGNVQWQIPSNESGMITKIDSALLPEVKWEDEEPTEVEIVPVKHKVPDTIESFVQKNLDKEVTVTISDCDFTGNIVGYNKDYSNDFVILELACNLLGWTSFNRNDVILSTNVGSGRFWYVRREIVETQM